MAPGALPASLACDDHTGDHNICYDLTPPGPVVDPTPPYLRSNT